MRMMFIVLIWAIASFTTAQLPDQNPAGRDCGGIYKCYVPEMCIAPPGPPGTPDPSRKTFDQSIVKSITKDDGIYVDCPVLFRFHAYTQYWLKVSIESLKEVTDEATISFDIVKKGSKMVLTQFSCARTCTKKEQDVCVNFKLEGSYRDKNPPGDPLVTNDPMTDFKCEFEVRGESETSKIFNYDSSHNFVEFKIGSKNTLNAILSFDFLMSGCDPSRLKFALQKNDEHKVYAEVKFKPGNEYYCAEGSNVHTMDYRPQEAPDYDTNVKLTCNKMDNSFYVKGSIVDDFDDIDIRCAADAQYFCLYNVKTTPGKTGPKRTPPNMKTKEKSELKCPDGLPHLIIDGDIIRDVKFECLNYGAETYWTDSVEKRILYDHGPAVYCTNEVKCHQVLLITESFVKNGKLDHNSLPACFEEGSLRTMDNKNVTGRWCNTKTGEYTYTVDGEEELRIMDKTTKFYCNYPPIHTTSEKDAQNLRTITTTLGSAVGGSVAIAIFAILIVCSCMWWRARRLVKKTRMAHKGAYQCYALTPEEKEALKIKNEELKKKNETKSKDQKPSQIKGQKPSQIKGQKPSQSSSSEPAEIADWNEMQMSFRHKGTDNMLKSDEEGLHKAHENVVSVHDAITASNGERSKLIKCKKTVQMDKEKKKVIDAYDDAYDQKDEYSFENPDKQ